VLGLELTCLERTGSLRKASEMCSFSCGFCVSREEKEVSFSFGNPNFSIVQSGAIF